MNAVVPRNTSLIKITFEGESVEKVKSFGDKYMINALHRINDVIVTKEKQRYGKEITELIKSDIGYISSKVSESNFTTADIQGRLKYLTDKIQKIEDNQLFIKADLGKEVNIPEKPVRPQKVKYIAIATVLGFFLSCGYVIAKYLIKK